MTLYSVTVHLKQEVTLLLNADWSADVDCQLLENKSEVVTVTLLHMECITIPCGFLS